jgi:hypothetical protein
VESRVDSVIETEGRGLANGEATLAAAAAPGRDGRRRGRGGADDEIDADLESGTERSDTEDLEDEDKTELRVNGVADTPELRDRKNGD